MKIAITATEATPEAEMDQRFGRAAYFLIHDTDTGEYAPVENIQNVRAAHGAGLQAAESVARSGASVVLTGKCGPKAFDALAAAGIQVREDCQGSVTDALKRYLSGVEA